MSQGTVVVGGHRFAITAIHIRGGELEITAMKHGPVPAMDNEPATVFGEDDLGFMQGLGQAPASITCPEVGKRQSAIITIKLRMTSVVASA